MLRRSAANKEANDKARRDYSKQYSGCVRRALGTHAHNRLVSDTALLSRRSRAVPPAPGVDSHSYMNVLKATSSYVPESDEDRARLGYTRPVECNLGFFASSDLCKAFDAPK